MDVEETSTFLYFPPSMLRICETAEEEIGGLLMFRKEKVGELNVLRLFRSEFVGGDPTSVNASELFHHHTEDKQWVLFHTHPPSKSYNGLSGDDILWIMGATFTTPVPKASHILITDKWVHYTIVIPNIYRKIQSLAREYKLHREEIEISTIYHEFISGMNYLAQIAEPYIRRAANEDEVVGLSVLNAIQFLPEDALTAHMLQTATRTITEDERPFLEWFRSRIPDTLKQNIEQQAEQRYKRLKEDATNPDNFGLLYTWSISKKDFVANKGILYLNDGGSVYDNFEETPVEPYDLNKDILPILFGKQEQEEDMVQEGGNDGAIVVTPPVKIDKATFQQISTQFGSKDTPHIPQKRNRTRRAKRYSRRR